MKRVVVLVMLMALICIGLYAEDKKNEISKYESFISKTGKITRFEDTNIDGNFHGRDIVTLRVRKITVGVDTNYYFQLTKETKYGNKTASIEYSDLLETIKAIDLLIEYAEKDKDSKVDYFENKFITDKFEIGYFKDNKIISWYMDLAKYGTEGTVFFKDIVSVRKDFVTAKEKIESMK